jgi:hypothetical protein
MIHPDGEHTFTHCGAQRVFPLELVEGARAHLCSGGSWTRPSFGERSVPATAQFAVIFDSVA